MCSDLTSHRSASSVDACPHDLRPPGCPATCFTTIDHVGIAVPDLDEAIAFYASTFGLRLGARGGQRGAGRPRGDARRRRLRHPHPAARAARAPESTIAKFIARNGPGIQQLAYRVADVEAVSATLRERGVRLLYDAPKRGTSDSPGQLRPPQGRRRRAGRAGRARGRRTECRITADVRVTLTVNSSVTIRRLPDLEVHRAGDPRRHPRRRHRAGRLRGHRRFPRPTGQSPSTRTRTTCSRAWRAATRTRASRLHVDEVPTPELGPGEALVAVMASAINYNTVWTSIFEPVSTFGFLERYGRLSRATPSATTCPTTWSAPTSPASCCAPGPGVNRGSPATRSSRTACRSSSRSPDGHDDTMMDPQQRIWGFETNFGGLAELALVKTNQLHAQARPPDLGGGRRPRAGQLDGLPPAGRPRTAPT